jgi:hypothetical protein
MGNLCVGNRKCLSTGEESDVPPGPTEEDLKEGYAFVVS